MESKVREGTDCWRDKWRQESCAPYRSGFGVGGVSVGVAGPREQDVFLGPQLQPFHLAAASYDIGIRIEWVNDLPKMPGRELFDSGAAWRLYEGQGELQFDFGYPLPGKPPHKRLFVDSNFCRATLQMSEEFFADIPVTPDPLEYPLDELLIMHRLTQEKAIELHGVGMVGPDGASNLFVGHSGAGKSTTARLWTSLHEVEILSDDRIIVREDKREDTGCRDTTQIFMYGTPWHGEAHFALPQRALLQRIFVLEHGHGNMLTRLTRSQMVAELFARSFVPFHRHEYVENALSFLERVADSVPCYRYSFEPDERAVQRILNFRD
ncbi:MAG TPA: hypothetical protein VNX26_16275 [Candidatus Acidoferrum sp.]|nr:hypothetical protein [Candidatus Acidoferrum sp.]